MCRQVSFHLRRQRPARRLRRSTVSADELCNLTTCWPGTRRTDIRPARHVLRLRGTRTTPRHQFLHMRLQFPPASLPEARQLHDRPRVPPGGRERCGGHSGRPPGSLRGRHIAPPAAHRCLAQGGTMYLRVSARLPRSRLRCWHLRTGAPGHADATGGVIRRSRGRGMNVHGRMHAAGAGARKEASQPVRRAPLRRGRPSVPVAGPERDGARPADDAASIPGTAAWCSYGTCSKKCVMRVGGIARLPRVQGNASPMQALSGRKIDARRLDLQREAVSLTRLRGSPLRRVVQVAPRQRPPHIATGSSSRRGA